MNLYTEILKWKTRLEALGIVVTLDEDEDLSGKLPIVVFEGGKSNGQLLSSGKMDVNEHSSEIHCIVSAQNVDFVTAVNAAEVLATSAMAAMAGLNITIPENGIDRGGIYIGAEKAREVLISVISSDE